MSDEIVDNILGFAVVRLNSDSLSPAESAEAACDLALYYAGLNDDDYVAVQVLGRTSRPRPEVQWVPQTPGTASPFPSVAQVVTPEMIAAAEAAPSWDEPPIITAPPIAPVQPAPPPAPPKPTPLPQVQPAVVQVENPTRAKPRYPNVRGIDLPTYYDVAATEGMDGPATKEQIVVAEGEVKRLGGSLAKTIFSWTGAADTAINAATMDAIIRILQSWVK